MSSVTDFSQSLAAIVEQTGPSVVRVEARRRSTSSGIVWSADGLIVTAQHTVEFEEDLEVGLPDGRTVGARFLGRDPTTDLALLQAEATGLTPAAWSGTEGLKVGHVVLAIARPGKSARASLGIVSALGPADEPFRAPGGGKLDRYVQTEVPAQQGFSGGAVVDAGGKLLGLHTTGFLRGTSLVVPSGTLKRVVENLKEHGSVRRGFLGVGTYPVRLPEAVEKQVGQGGGLLVVSVAPDSPASKSGLMMGDLVLSLGGQPTQHVGDLLTLLDAEKIGTESPLRIIRAGQPQDVKITIAARG